MPTYVTLINRTDQGIRKRQGQHQPGKQAEEMMGKLGVRFKSIQTWTGGPIDGTDRCGA